MSSNNVIEVFHMLRKKGPYGWGYVKREKINGKWTTVIVPEKKISYEEGVEKIREIAKKLKNGNGD